MRNPAFSIAILICCFCLVGDAGHGQEKPIAAPAIFIVAVKGESLGDTKQAFASVAEELRRQYWLGYYPTNTARDGRYRKILVTVDRPDVVIRAGDGYRAPSGDSRQ